MTELGIAREIPQIIQTLGLIAPVIACCYGKLTRAAGSNYMLMGQGKDRFERTGENLPALQEKDLELHDHEIGGIIPKLKKKQMVASIPNGDRIDYVLVEEKDLTSTRDLLKEGDKIPGNDLPHNHKGTKRQGPYEYLDPEPTS